MTYAAIGTDGIRFVVWGVGASVGEACSEAEYNAREADEFEDVHEFDIIRLTEEELERVNQGVVALDDLGISYQLMNGCVIRVTSEVVL